VLTDANYNEHVMESEDPWMIHVYDPNDAEIKELDWHWNALASYKPEKLKVAKIDKTKETGLVKRFVSNNETPFVFSFKAGKENK